MFEQCLSHTISPTMGNVNSDPFLCKNNKEKWHYNFKLHFGNRIDAKDKVVISFIPMDDTLVRNGFDIAVCSGLLQVTVAYYRGKVPQSTIDVLSKQTCQINCIFNQLLLVVYMFNIITQNLFFYFKGLAVSLKP